MTSTFDRLNLRPMERRIVLAAMVLGFLVINYIWVWPHFSDWGKAKIELQNTQATLQKWQREIAKAPEYKAQKEKYEGEGLALLPEEVAVQLRRTIQNQASQSGLVPSVNDLPRQPSRPDQFFEEQSVKLNFSGAGDKELIDFLYNISAGRSMIRVKDLNIRPDGQMQRLVGEATLTASYQKRTAAPTRGASNTTPAKTTSNSTVKTSAPTATPSSATKPVAKPKT